MTSQTSLLGAAGEFFVMSELLRRGYIAALAPAGVPNADIIVADQSGQRLCSIQVKTRRDIGSDGGWHMNEKHEAGFSDQLFFVFVDLGKLPTDRPKTFVVPSQTVAKAVGETYKYWLHKPGKGGKAHKAHTMRRLCPDYSFMYGDDRHPTYSGPWLEHYQDKWLLLPLSADQSLLEITEVS